jgi:hypothetical protein
MTPYLLNMIIVVILGAIILGWFIGNVLLNKWIKDSIEESNNIYTKHFEDGKSTKGPSKTKKQKIS